MVPTKTQTFHQNAKRCYSTKHSRDERWMCDFNAMECKMQSQWIAINASNQKTRTNRRNVDESGLSPGNGCKQPQKELFSHSPAPPASKMPKKRRLSPLSCVLVLEEIDQLPNGSLLVLNGHESLDLVSLRTLDLQALNISQNGRLVVYVSNDPERPNHLCFCTKMSGNGPAVLVVLEQFGSRDCDGGERPDQQSVDFLTRFHHTLLSLKVRCKRDNCQIEALPLERLEILNDRRVHLVFKFDCVMVIQSNHRSLLAGLSTRARRGNWSFHSLCHTPHRQWGRTAATFWDLNHLNRGSRLGHRTRWATPQRRRLHRRRRCRLHGCATLRSLLSQWHRTSCTTCQWRRLHNSFSRRHRRRLCLLDLWDWGERYNMLPLLVLSGGHLAWLCCHRWLSARSSLSTDRILQIPGSEMILHLLQLCDLLVEQVQLVHEVLGIGVYLRYPPPPDPSD